MKLLFRFLVDMKEQTSLAIKHLREEPVQSLSVVLPTMACIISCIRHLALYVGFVISGEYVRQIEIIKTDFWSADFISGNFASLHSTWLVGLLINLCLASGFVLLVVLYWRGETKTKRISITVILSIVGLSIMALLLFNAIVQGKIPISHNGIFAKLLISVGIERFSLILMTIFAISVLLSCLFIFFSKNRQLLIFQLGAIALSNVLIPLLFWLIENIVFFTAIAVVGILIYIGFRFLLAILHDSASQSGSSHSQPKPSMTSPKKAVPEKKIPEKRFYDNTRFYIDDGYGIGAPLTKCIFADTPFFNHVYVCTLQAYQKGEVHIYLNDKPFHGI